MEPSSFRSDLHRLADWVADYRESVASRPVLASTNPGDVARQLPASAPDQGEPLDAILRDVSQLLMPGITHWNHPRFFAYFPANNSEPSILAELMMAAMGAQCMSWQTSPAATELEHVVMGWLGQLLGMPEGFEGVIQDTASSATLVSLLMARERATDGQFRTRGAAAADARNLRIYASSEAHSSIEKAVFLAGMGSDNLRSIDVDSNLAMNPRALRDAIKADAERGLKPCAVVATVGTTSTLAVDPVPEIGRVCAEHGAFLHVDAAFAGSLAALPEMRWLMDGVEQADSFVVNPHKWMYVNFDCSAHWVKDTELLLRTCAIDPEYLKTDHDPEVRNYRDWGIPLGRRFRALKLWWVLRSMGTDEIRRRLRGALEMAAGLERRVLEHPELELVTSGRLGLVCFRHRRAELGPRIMKHVNDSGEAYITHTKVNGHFTLRWHTAQALTTEEDVAAGWEALSAAIEAATEGQQHP